jgi:cysteinyl-tRNA synthetase
MLKFHNTLSRKIEEFQPLTDGRVRMYTCGPTVHNYIHIGNLRTFIFEDLLRRTLKHLGYQVTQVMNITDIDDKTIKGSQAQGITLNEFTAPYIRAFFDDLKTLNIEPAEVYPRATEHIPEMVALIERLAAKGLTYDAEDGIYFPIARFPHYGRLSGFDINQVKVGARVSQDQYDKEDARDFALWKKEKPGEPAWDAPFGRGRPGWHIECSAMSMKYLGETFDIHTGGVDNIFPHHENELAQSEGATGKPLARYWLHSEHLMIEGEKMAKSLHNFYTLRELLDKGNAPMAIRYLLLSTHYRKRLSFTYEGLEGAQSVIRRFSDLKLRLNEVIQAGGKKKGHKPLSTALGVQKQAFDSALEDDLSISPALAAVFEVMRVANISLEEGTISAEQAQSALEFLATVDKVLGIMGVDQAEERLPQEILDLVEKREQARQARNYKLADELRKRIETQGYLLEDTPQGARVKRG